MNIDKLKSNKAEFSKNIHKGLALFALAAATLSCVLGGGSDSNTEKTQTISALRTQASQHFDTQFPEFNQTLTPPSSTSTPTPTSFQPAQRTPTP